MRINAYLLAADPARIEASVASYYALAQTIVVSYDASGTSWSGTPLAVKECLQKLRRIDPGKKFRFHPGHYALPECDPLQNDTRQRQSALDLAGRGADWVLQIDTDEVLADPAAFAACLEEAGERGFNAMEYPARWLFRDIGDGHYLERCTHLWRAAANYPGPVAVRPGVRLHCARQCDGRLFRVDFRPRNTDPYHGAAAPVHRVVRPAQGIFHYSWIREEAELLRKTAAWGHSREDWSAQIAYWRWAGRHPLLAVITTPLRPYARRFRIATPCPFSSQNGTRP
ncbi:MAG: hypothetical protein PHQ12_13745 [Chthoniobacteraceae bacterium]|nr:hypothetical protein [Chthoniobacteraceae bacterium]